MAVFDKKQDFQSVIAEIIRRVNDNSKRLRLVEQRSATLESSMETIDKSILEQFKQVKISIDKLGARIEELGNSIAKLEDDSRKTAKLMERVATKNELKELQGFIDLINPMKSSFITRPEVKRMLDERKNEQ
ncbi:MAG: hypothetical protein V1836_03620 [Candidatus Aenigmatarchaeota archaeon]